MRVAVSDYDGTLCQERRVGNKVLAAVRHWRDAGNVLAIATGRDPCTLLPEMAAQGVVCDFIICLNGAALYDSGAVLLKKTPIPRETVLRLLGHPAARACRHFLLCASGDVKAHLRSDSWHHTLRFPYETVTEEEIDLMRPYPQITFGYGSDEESAGWEERLLADMGKKISIHRNGGSIDVTSTGVGKAEGIANMLAITVWPAEGILVVGDGANDIGMIRRYNGYAVDNALPEVIKLARGTCRDVGALLSHMLDT